MADFTSPDGWAPPAFGPSALPVDLDGRLTAALERERELVEAEERAAGEVSSGVSAWWSDLIGAESSAAGARTGAHSSRSLYEVHLARAAAVRASGDVDALRVLMADLGDAVAAPSAVLEAAHLLRPSTAVLEVGAATARDVAAVAEGVGRSTIGALVAAPWLLLAGAGLFLLVKFGIPRRRTP